MSRIDARLVGRLYRQADAKRWDVSLDTFADALERSAAKRFGSVAPTASDLESYLASLHLADVALACACASGNEAAWEHFVREFRPALYRAADAIDASGAARELADSIYGDLFGLRGGHDDRRSLFRYFHGRSGLATWLRAVLSQRHIDAIRARARLDPLPTDDEAPAPLTTTAEEPSADRSRLFAAIQRVLLAVIATLEPRDRLRLGCYYAQQMTLAEIGRLLREHEATVSRNLARTRRIIREDVERRLRDAERLGPREIEECFASVVRDPGTLDLSKLLASDDRKNRIADRSTNEGMP